MRVKLALATAIATLAASGLAARAPAHGLGTATIRASGALSGKLSTRSCIVPSNPLNASLHKRFVIMVFSSHGATITLTLDVWKTGKINLVATRADSVGLASQTTSGASSGWFAGWTGTQAPRLSPDGKPQGSGTLVTSKDGRSGTIDATLVAAASNKSSKKPLHLKGTWTGC